MRRRERLNQILSAVVARGQVDVPTLASEFDVSDATIRRDLEALQRQRLVCRTHGGAAIHAAFNDLPLSFKTAQDLPEKRSISLLAAEFLEGARVIGPLAAPRCRSSPRCCVNVTISQWSRTH